MGNLDKNMIKRHILRKSMLKGIDRDYILNYLKKEYRLLFNYFPGACVVCDTNGMMIDINEAFLKLTKCTKDDFNNKSIFEFLHLENTNIVSKCMDIMTKEVVTLQSDFLINTKEIRNMKVIIIPILRKQTLLGMYIVLLDNTENSEIETNTKYISNRDMLTKLYNRSYLVKQINFQCKEAEKKENSFALIMVDIDGFTYINDALGDQLGDELMVRIAQRLKIFLGNENCIFRYLGDQFAVIVPELSTIEECESIANAIMDLFSEPFKIGIHELAVTISIGISIYPEDGKETDSLIKNANTAMLGAKNEGKNRYKFYSSKMDIQSYKQFILRNDLQKAIEKDQFKVYYQPQVNLKTNEILAAEALVRWEHPTWGLIFPNEFIPLAEETGVSINLGKWILREVCRNYKQWLKDGLPNIKMAINYSSIQFYENNFVDNIKEVIDEFELDPKFLIIEVTENVLMNNLEQVISYMKKLQDLGIQVALDDFGTGFSSLSYLNTFSVDILKVDRSFIMDIPLNKTNTKITKSIINLAQSLEIKVVTEGIENWDQLSYLKKINCCVGQGFLYSKAIPLKEFEKILAKKECKPTIVNDSKIDFFEEKRKFFRIDFSNLLEADMTILRFDGRDVKVGNTKVVIKNIGAGGLRFISNIRLPITQNIVLQFKTEVLEEIIDVYGYAVWIKEVNCNLYQYGIQFTLDENERAVLIRLLNTFQIKMKNNNGFTNGRFILDSPIQYFKSK